jgi:hypothetical protein
MYGKVHSRYNEYIHIELLNREKRCEVKVTENLAPVVAGVVDDAARDGQVLSAGAGAVVIGLQGVAHQFTIADPDGGRIPVVVFTATARMLPHGTGVFTPVFDERTGGPYVVADRPASRIIAAHDRFGHCRMCATYQHEGCVAQVGEPCTCECAAEWLAVRVAAAAMTRMMHAPTTRPDNSWNLPCLCACQDGGDCGGCGHTGCATRAEVRP